MLGLDSIDSLLLSPCELLIKRDKLAMLDRLRDIAAEEIDEERWPSRNCDCGGCAWGTGPSLVMVEALLVSEGTSSTDGLISGPGSPMSRDWKLCSSFSDDGAVEIRCVSYEKGDRGEGKEDWVAERGLVGVGYGGCKL